MRIDRVQIKNFKNLIDFEIDLNEDRMETVLLGKNAMGKSNFIEALILIFKNLDLNEDPPFQYKIWYQIKKRYLNVNFENGNYEFNIITKGVKLGEKDLDLVSPGMTRNEFQKQKKRVAT